MRSLEKTVFYDDDRGYDICLSQVVSFHGIFLLFARPVLFKTGSLPSARPGVQ
jgi:hypothetical protein